ncbi:MAG TPA: zf-HC2 domain-containing protein [Candidatus Acidoferrales bacterium]|nr:zf-HC2 domain-containing protein [Candidatus Acidoferrales bacterium]
MSEQNMNGCEKFEAFLEDYLSGDLPRHDAERLASHLNACTDCRQALEEARLASRLVGLFDRAEEPGPGFTRLVMARVSTAELWLQQQKNFWRPLEALAWRLAFSAALVLVFLFAYEIRASNPEVVPPASAVLVQQADTFVTPAYGSPSNSDEVLLAIAERHHEQQ